MIFPDFPGPGIFKKKNPGLSKRRGNTDDCYWHYILSMHFGIYLYKYFMYKWIAADNTYNKPICCRLCYHEKNMEKHKNHFFELPIFLQLQVKKDQFIIFLC